MNIENDNSSHHLTKTQPLDSSFNPYESSQISLLSNNQSNNDSFASICLDCLQCCSASMEIIFCCCIFTECLSQCH